tara:strand:+ start:10068 stop:10826 length:759 start_codon:yes stop_codon:yes gene_type:complete
MYNINDMHLEKFGAHFHGVTEESMSDYWVLDTIGDRTGGTFIEAGGSWPSTCINLEKYWGWRGKIFEPNNNNHNMIERVRDSPVYNNCIWKDNNGVEFIEPIDKHKGNISYIEGCLSPILKYEPDQLGETIRVVKGSITLNDIFEQDGWTHCNFVSLDIEGAEGQVITAWNHEKYSVDCLQLEGGHLHFDLMKYKGYTLVEQPFSRLSTCESAPNSPRDSFDKFYINNNLLNSYKHRIFEQLDDYFKWCEHG